MWRQNERKATPLARLTGHRILRGQEDEEARRMKDRETHNTESSKCSLIQSQRQNIWGVLSASDLISLPNCLIGQSHFKSPPQPHQRSLQQWRGAKLWSRGHKTSTPPWPSTNNFPQPTTSWDNQIRVLRYKIQEWDCHQPTTNQCYSNQCYSGNNQIRP